MSSNKSVFGRSNSGHTSESGRGSAVSGIGYGGFGGGVTGTIKF